MTKGLWFSVKAIPPMPFFLLYEGVVDLKVGGEKTVYSLTEKSDIFGWSSLVADANYTATAIANTDIQAIKIDARKLNRVFNANPLFGLEIYRRLSSCFQQKTCQYLWPAFIRSVGFMTIWRMKNP